MSKHATEVMLGKRFEFGENWLQFLKIVDSRRVAAAVESLESVFGKGSLKGKRFLDAGSGSGLFSLAARMLGAAVHSFDFDPQSVACTRELRRRYFENDSDWVVEEGSVLDTEFLGRIGVFDVVYSWGVVHHTGAMWQALENIAPLVSTGGTLWIAVYNDQGRASIRWKWIKSAYCKAPRTLRSLIVVAAFARLWGPTIIRDAATGRIGATWRHYAKSHERGMSPWRDVVDWVGGFPFEVSTPEKIFAFYRAKGFQLARLKTCAGGIGCNEYVFTRDPST